MKKIILTLIIICCSSLVANAQWIRQESGTTINLWDVYFLNLNTGWACGGTMIYKTTNGGINWVNQPTPAQCYISQIHAVDSNIIYAAGWFTILKSTNGGTNWIGIMTGTFGSGLPVFEGLYFLNVNTGWLCGSLQTRKTTDGGLTFDSVYVSAELTDIYFKNELEGVSSGEYTVRWTSDGGQTWITSIMKNELRQVFDRLSFINNMTGFIVGDGKISFKTTDFGISWDSVGRIISDQIIYSSIFTSENIGYAGGTYGVLFKTTNGGQSWGFQDTNHLGHGYIKSFWGFNDSILWAVGGGGKIIHTTTGGNWIVGIKNQFTEIPKEFELYQNYPNPFNPITKIKFEVPLSKGGLKGVVSLKVYDILGKEIQTLVNEPLQPGSYEVTFDGSQLPSGVYFYKLTTEGFSETKKMLMIK